ncbi:unnamed protein product [Peniophora sp. CBMAI 1063]|nr:unnamed protein product [Peniophora sp. CBMAI 1063]
MPSIISTIRTVGIATRRMFDAMKYGLDPIDVALPSEYEHLRPELARIADRVLSASFRHYVLDWDSQAYYDVTRTQDGGNFAKEVDFREQFRPLDPGDTIRDPCIIVDKKGHVEGYILPDTIEPKRLVRS